MLAKPQSPLPTPGNVQGPRFESNNIGSLNFLEFKARYPTVIGRNHYKGERVFENFGYVLDEETQSWIDPDSSGLLRDQYISGQPLNALGQGNDHLPDFRRSEKSGPRIMSPEEQDIFYKDFVDDVTDDVDAEGDPRNFRLTSATFARWAEGAHKGDGYAEEHFTPVCYIFLYFLSPLTNIIFFLG